MKKTKRGPFYETHKFCDLKICHSGPALAAYFTHPYSAGTVLGVHFD